MKILIAFLSIILLLNCSDSSNNAIVEPNNIDDSNNKKPIQKSGTIFLKVSSETSHFKEVIKKVEAIIYADDIDTLKNNLSMDDNLITGTINNIPVGKNRTVVVNGYDKDEKLQYTGESKTDVEESLTNNVELTINRVSGDVKIDVKIEDQLQIDTSNILLETRYGKDSTEKLNTYIFSKIKNTNGDTLGDTLNILSYFANGSLKQQQIYENGKKKETISYLKYYSDSSITIKNDKGEKLNSYYFDNSGEIIKVVSYWTNGNIKKENFLADGKLISELWYDEQGIPLVKNR